MYHYSIAWFPSVEEISLNLSYIFLSASHSAARRLQEKDQSAAIPFKGHIFVTFVDTSVHRVMYQLPLSNMRAGEGWINTSKSHDSLPWSREEKSKEPSRESLARISGLSHLSDIKMCIFPTSLQKCLPPQMRNSLPYCACLACERSTVWAGLCRCHIKGWTDSHTCIFICFQSFKIISHFQSSIK